MAKDNKVCDACGKETNDWYPIRTNKGRSFRCAECYELLFMRNQRDEYANFSDSTHNIQKG